MSSLQTRPAPLFGMMHDLRYADLDANGHVNNGTYLSLMETARSLFLLELGEKSTAVLFVVVKIEIEFRRELRWPGSVHSSLDVARLGTTSFTLDQRIWQEGNEMAAAMVTVVGIDAASRRPVPIPPALRAALPAGPAADSGE